MAMRRRISRTIGFLYQRVWGKLLILVAAVVVLTVGVGLLVTYGFAWFDGFGDGAWWAFVHLLDPSAVLEDETWAMRILGSLLVVCGIVLIIGILFEVLTQVVDRSLSRLDDASVSVPFSGHVVFDGWRWSLPDVIQEMARVRTDPVSEVVVVAPADLYDERAAMRSALRWRGDPTVELLFGDARNADRLARARAQTARTVAVVRDDSNTHDPATVDLDVIKRVLTLAGFLHRSGEDGPAVFYELTQARNGHAAGSLIPYEFSAIVDDSLVSDILRLTVLEPHWALLVTELLAESSGLRIRGGDWADKSLRSVDEDVEELVVAALVASGAVDLDPDRTLGDGDRIVTLPWNGPVAGQSSGRPVAISESVHRRVSISIVGWNQTVSEFIKTLRAMRDVTVEISSIAPIDEGTRARELAAAGVASDEVTLVNVPPRDTDAIERALTEHRPDAVIVTSTVDGSGGDAMKAADAEAVFNLLSIRQMPAAPKLVVADLFAPDIAGPIGERTAGALGDAVNAGLAPIVPIGAVLDRITARLLAEPEFGSVLDTLIGDDTRPPVELTVAAGGPASFAEVRRHLWTPHCSIVGAIIDGHPVLAPDATTTITPGTGLLAFTHEP